MLIHKRDKGVKAARDVLQIAKSRVAADGAAGQDVGISHAVLSGPAIERLEKSSLEEVILLDTIPLGEDKILDKFKILSVAPLFAEAMIRIHRNDSVSKMFD